MAKNIHNATGHGNLDEIKRFLKKGVLIDEKNAQGMTPLMMAARFFYNDVVEWLINNGCDINIVDNAGRSALMHAAYTGNADGIKILINSGASITNVDADGLTVLAYCARHGRPEALTELLKHQPDLRDLNEALIKAIFNTTPIFQNPDTPSECGIEIFNILLEHGADPSYKDSDLKTAKDYAKENKKEKYLEILSKA